MSRLETFEIVNPMVLSAFAALVFGARGPDDSLRTIAMGLGLDALAVIQGAPHAHHKGKVLASTGPDGIVWDRDLPSLYGIPISSFDDPIRLVGQTMGVVMPQALRDRLDMAAPYFAALWAAAPDVASRMAEACNDAPGKGLLDEENPYRLTRAERRICALLAQGQRPKDMSDSLNVSMTTVRTHLRQIYAKSGLDGMFAVKHHLQSTQTHSIGDK